ncbi:hypothetical protein FQN53_004958 [Emmonsiellopsis sp. PD_33]|nr:hypothetical protein FQN53_004958 [Emmonsiellopsis sp. PD_33]
MVDPEQRPQSPRFALNNFQTAICVIPPTPLVENINRLRELYDQTFKKWPAHVNVIYPFVSVNRLPEAVELIRSKLIAWKPDCDDRDVHLRLDKAGYFHQRQGNIIHIGPGADEELRKLNELRNEIIEPFKLPANDEGREYHPHLTIGQTKAQDDTDRDYLLAKARLLPPVEWRVGQLAILVREKTGQSTSMRMWGTINLDETACFERTTFGQNLGKRSSTSSINSDLSLQSLQVGSENVIQGTSKEAESRVTYEYSEEADVWIPTEPSSPPEDEEEIPATLRVSSFNVLVETPYPPDRERYPVLLQTLLAENSLADVLMLQEVSDDFLEYILGNEAIQTRYPFSTHGPPGQEGIGPMPSLRNVVALSRSNFSWSWLPFGIAHKGAVVLSLNDIGKLDDDEFFPTVVAGVHLSSGLFDYAVAARKQQLHQLVDYFSSNYPDNPQIITGDFNMSTSSFTHQVAVESNSITAKTAMTLPILETILPSAGLLDAWVVARKESKDVASPSQLEREFTQLYDGEQGATFDPHQNPLTLKSSGSNPNPRPERYDRLFFSKRDFKIAKFNMFGFAIRGATGELEFPSDHWGISAILKFDESGALAEDSTASSTAVQVKMAHYASHDPAGLKLCLADQSIVPSPEQSQLRKAAFSRLRDVIQHGAVRESDQFDSNSRAKFSIIATPVGSYGSGVWTASSDVDCLCVGSISSKTFFELAMQRLRKAADSGVKILRKVKAATGTMLELEVLGIKFDLQYCPAAAIAERWLQVSILPQSDPIFDLALLPLMKLQPYRDQCYLQRTIQNPATFRLLHRIIKAWAKHRGIYSSKFGYLGGIHITMMLSRLLKLLPSTSSSLNPADILCTFFNHYGNFNWKEEMVYDSSFYKRTPRYHRGPREAMVILTLHAPVTNVARSASIPAMRTVVEEMKLADRLISSGKIGWTELVGIPREEEMPALSSPANEFLTSYNSYIKINVQYWGLSLAKGSSLVGWLESRCLLLLADISRKLPDIHTRIWPARFTPVEDSASSTEEEREYQGCYLIGLTKSDDTTANTPRILSKSERKIAQDTLQASIDRFATQIQTDKNYFDPTSAWVDVSHVKQADLGPLKLDTRDWGDYVIQDDTFDDSEDEDDEDSDIDMDDEDEAAAEADLVSSTTHKHKDNKKSSKSTTTGTKKPKSAQKLRPASDILSRLRWDPSHDSAEYVVGYEDRFLGAREIPLDRWKSEQTDEEFIPQHRILYFKRKGDGRVVWDRERRVDAVFGSGVGKGEEGGEGGGGG